MIQDVVAADLNLALLLVCATLSLISALMCNRRQSCYSIPQSPPTLFNIEAKINKECQRMKGTVPWTHSIIVIL